MSRQVKLQLHTGMCVCKKQLRRSGPKGLDRARGNGPDHSYNKQALYARLLLTPQLRGGVYSTLVSVSKKLSPVLVSELALTIIGKSHSLSRFKGELVILGNT